MGFRPRQIASFNPDNITGSWDNKNAHPGDHAHQSSRGDCFPAFARWGQAPYSTAFAEKARPVYRPDLHRGALARTGIDLLPASAKVEGALKTATPVACRNGATVLGPDGFFDGRLFDPHQLETYLESFGVQNRGAAK